jgi:hypothetical protein
MMAAVCDGACLTAARRLAAGAQAHVEDGTLTPRPVSALNRAVSRGDETQANGPANGAEGRGGEKATRQ